MSGVNTSDWCLFAALNDDGGAETHRYFGLPRDQVEIVDTWHAVGLKGSASNDVTVAEVFVPGHRTLSSAHLKGGPSPGNAINTGPLYRTPSYCLFGVYISAAVLGIAEAGLELYLDGARSRVALVSRQKVGGYPTQQVKVAEASGGPAAARQLLLAICDEKPAASRPATSLPSDEQWGEVSGLHAAFAGRPGEPAPWSCCGTPAPAAASTAAIRCRASIATSASPAATSRRTGTSTARPTDAS